LINENRKKGEGSFLVFVEGLSMYPLFEPGSRVPVKLMPSGTEYDVGDVIVFKRLDSYVIHAVIDSYVYKGKTYYVIGGLNQETNHYVDCATISSDHILGIADLSEEFLAGIPTPESQGLLFEMKAYGMINQFDTLLQRSQEVHERIADIDESNKEAVLDALVEYMELLIEFKRTNTDHLDIRNQFIQATREADFLASYLHIVNNIFRGYSSDLFKQMFGKILGNVIDPRNPRAIRGDLNEAFDKIKILTEVLRCSNDFITLNDLIKILDRKIDSFSELGRSFEEGKRDFINEMIKEIWDLENYDALFLKQIESQIQQFRFSSSFSNVYEGEGSDKMKYFSFNMDLGPNEIKVAIFKNLMDAKLVKILKNENPTEYGDLQPNQYGKMLEALGIIDEVKDLTDADIMEIIRDLKDADIMDIARKRFGWGDWNDGKGSGNVAYITFKVKHGEATQTIIYFAKSGSQDFGNIDSNHEVWQALEGHQMTLWDSERKIFLAFLDKINNQLDRIEQIEITVASERGFCTNCKSIIKDKLVNYITQIKELREINSLLKLSVILRNEGPPTTRGVRNPQYNKDFFIVLLEKYIDILI
jgi:hypothetical protein